ncbi:DNA cytosine methyltransferase, partial [Aliivibrio wodanis]
ERCHPIHTRPLQVREYARIQTFPDNWEFQGSKNAAYKQIGNAVPVNMARALGHSLVRLLNDIEVFDCDTSSLNNNECQLFDIVNEVALLKEDLTRKDALIKELQAKNKSITIEADNLREKIKLIQSIITQ